MPVEHSFVTALLVGLLGSTHCIGMCGGIVSALSMTGPNELAVGRYEKFFRLLAYNAGRIGSYIAVGALSGFIVNQLGAFLPESNLPIAALISALFVIALGLYLANWWRFLSVLEGAGNVLWQHIRPLGQRWLPARNVKQAFALGLIWGWLPCGLVYAAVAWSLSSGDWVQGALIMLGFGLGTLPALLLVGSGASGLNRLMRNPTLRTSAGVALIAFGLYSAVSSLGEAAHHHPVVSVHPKLQTLEKLNPSFSVARLSRQPALDCRFPIFQDHAA
ncbi:MAG: sulfite exporter TauE/SafE [Planctomycetota bacterium]|jgi:sulfite exporter TauE/SafE